MRGFIKITSVFLFLGRGRKRGAKAPRFLFNGNDIIIYRLAAGQQADLRLGAGRREDLLRPLGLLLCNVLSIEDRDKLCLLVSLRVGQPVQHGFQVPVRAKELVLLQGQIVPLLDGKAAKVGVPRRVGNLTGPDPAKAVGHGGSIVLLAGVRFGAQHSGDALGDSLGGQDYHLTSPVFPQPIL